MLSEFTGLSLLANKEPVVATHVGQFNPEATAATFMRYGNEQQTFVVTPAIQKYQSSLVQTVLENQTAIGCLVAPFGYGKTSTAISIWRACDDAGLLAVPPFSCNSVAEMGQAIASAIIYRLQEDGKLDAASAIEQAYEEYLVSSAQRLAQQDAEKYAIEYDTALQSIQEKIESGHLHLEASGTSLLQFLERVVRIVVSADYRGLVVLIDEFQQFLGNINKAVITNFRTLIWGLRTRGDLPLGFVLTMDPDTERNLIDRGADILHRIRNDGLYLAFADVYDREFPRELWSRYAEAFGFLEDSQRIVDLPTLEAIGQICERPDLSNGPRTVINIFQQIAISYSERNQSYSPLDLIDDFLAGNIRFDGDRGKIPSLVNELTSYDYIKRVPERVETLKLLAAFPRGCSGEVAERYGLKTTFDFLLDELRGEVVLQLPEGVALIDLQRVGKPQDKLRIILKKYWMQITEAEIIADRARWLFAQYGVEPLFPEYISINEGWRSLTDGFQLTETDGYFQLYEGTFFAEFPMRRVATQVCSSLDQAVRVEDVDVHLVFLIQSGSVNEIQLPPHLDNHRTLVLPIPIDQPFDRRLPRDIRDIEDFLSPVVLTPGVLVSLLDYIHKQVPQIEGVSEAEALKIEDKTRKLQEFLLSMVFSDRLFEEHGIQIYSRGTQAVRDALFRILKQSYPHYQTLLTSPAWRQTLDTYQDVLSQLNAAQRRGIEPLSDRKTVIASTFGQRSHAGFDSYVRQYEGLINIADWRGDSGEVEFTRHPAEQILIEAISVDDGLDQQAVNREARNFGYLPDEVDYLLRFLELRGYIEYDEGSGRFYSAHTLSQAELVSLAHDVNSEASLLYQFLRTEELNSILSALADVQQELKDDSAADYADIQVRLLQFQRQVREIRPDVVQSIYDHLHGKREYLYMLISQVNKAIPESGTGLPLDKHVNGAQRAILKSVGPLSKRLESLRVDVSGVTQQKVDISSLTLHQLEEHISGLDDLAGKIEKALLDAKKHIRRIELQHEWLYLVDRIKRLFDSIEVAREFTDVTLLKQRLTELVDDIQQALATRGTQEYQDIFDEYQPRVEALGQELDRLMNLATHVQRSVPESSFSSPEYESAQVMVSPTSRSANKAGYLETRYHESRMSPEDFIDYLFQLEREGKIEIRFKEND
jgi:hypothetical protein